MQKTKLQVLLEDVSPTRVAKHLGCVRQVIYQWRIGKSFPRRDHAEKLIEFFGRERLDFNGCYHTDHDSTG